VARRVSDGLVAAAAVSGAQAEVAEAIRAR
jgi:hypothetical protein